MTATAPRRAPYRPGDHPGPPDGTQPLTALTPIIPGRRARCSRSSPR